MATSTTCWKATWTWRVVGVRVGPVDTDGAAWMNAPKVEPADVADQTVRALEADHTEVLVDELARAVKASLSQPR